MADSDNTTTLPFVIGRQGVKQNVPERQAIDPASGLWSEWQKAQYASLLLCRVQQRLEARMMATTGIPVSTSGQSGYWPMSVAASEASAEYAVAREAEVFAMTEALKFQDAIPSVAALSLVGIIAKLDMIVGADRDIGDPTDFPWPHIASVLRDLKALTGDLPAYRPDRTATRADVERYWNEAIKLVTALSEDSQRNAPVL
ncbi:hypothetical protein FJ970_10685 [Mesorhizobium sp. B2-1-8]|uniref:hypothetical protein n=1 Tax=Mesorhizobium sp. B2-1-8 TaxID=2589967 RepID=UPI001D10FBDF|nr:hypothetical protein [Mesorhizobium sp. B2-1-8]UCI21382.1 hypothetical protein FJ970_10685 [Mesorhizobium sp. B2-1-8]